MAGIPSLPPQRGLSFQSSAHDAPDSQIAVAVLSRWNIADSTSFTGEQQELSRTCLTAPGVLPNLNDLAPSAHGLGRLPVFRGSLLLSGFEYQGRLSI